MILHWHGPCSREIGRTATHLYLRPHPRLSPYVAHYTVWRAPVAGGPPSLSLLPDASGCLVCSPLAPGCPTDLWGATTSLVRVDNGLTGPVVRLFVEFSPCGLYLFTGLPQRELANRRPELTQVEPAFHESLCLLLEEARDLDELARGLDRLLLAAFVRRSLPPALLDSLHRLGACAGAVSVADLSQGACYSPRHLNRLFGEYLGVSVKTFARILRINSAARQLQAGIPPARLAQNAGYFDQSHLIRDFKAVCGVSPGDYLQNLSAFYNEPLKL